MPRVAHLFETLGSAVGHAELDRDRHLEERRVIVDGLRLRYRDGRQLCTCIPFVRDVEVGMAGVQHPLIEERREVQPADLLDGAGEIDRLDVAHGVVGDVARDRLPPQVVAQLRADHVQHARALFVEVPSEMTGSRRRW